MAEVKWIKIVTDIFDDEKILLIESMPDADAIIVIWFKLLCLAGKQNNQGVFMVSDRLPYTDEMFATIFRRNINTVRLALKTFEQFDMIEISNGVVTIPKWEKHQSLDALEKSREATKNRVSRWRERQKLITSNVTDNVTCNVTDDVTVTDGNGDRIDKNKKENKNNNISSNAEAFERIWKQYPRKQGRKEALAAFERAVKHGAKIEDIEKGVLQYKEYVEKCGIDMKYVKQGSTYFRNESWNDDYSENANVPDAEKPSYDIDEFEKFAITYSGNCK